MKRNRTIGIRLAATSKAAKWTAWAWHFASRFHLHADPSDMALLLAVRGGRTSVAIQERWLHQAFHYRPRFHWQINLSPVSRVVQSFARQMSVFNSALVVSQRSALQASVVAKSVAPPPGMAYLQPLAQAVGWTRHEFSMQLERRFLERQSSVSTRTTERLVHRSNRVEQVGVIERTLTLRRDPMAAMRSVVETLSRANAQTPDTRRPSFPMPSAPTVGMPALNVDQLADQVIRQIDRRVIARRERMGRT